MPEKFFPFTLISHATVDVLCLHVKPSASVQYWLVIVI